MSNKYINRILKISFLIIAVLFSSLFFQFTSLRDTSHSGIRVYGFYQQPRDSLDVIVMGASEVYVGYNAPMAYSKYGFTSYPYAVAGNRPSAWKTMIREIQSTQKPKLIAIEINGLCYQKEEQFNDLASSHYVIDQIPDWDRKSQAIAEMGCEDSIAYYIPIAKYKNKIFKKDGKQINTDFITMKLRGYSLLKGNFGVTGYFPAKGKVLDVSENENRRKMNVKFEDELIKFLEYCKKNDIDNILFYKAVHRITDINGFEKNVEYANSAEDIIKKYGYNVARFDKVKYKDIDIDPDKDFYNDGHLNYKGQQKFTDYFSKYIVENYDIKPSNLNYIDRQHWEESVEYTKLYYKYAEELTNEGKKDPLSENKRVIRKLKEMKEKGQ